MKVPFYYTTQQEPCQTFFLVEKDLEILDDIWLNMRQQCAQGPRWPVAAWLVSEMAWPGHQGSDYPSVLGTGEATSQTLSPVLGPSLLERHRGAGVCPEE